eukprot:s3129_g14.t7
MEASQRKDTCLPGMHELTALAGIEHNTAAALAGRADIQSEQCLCAELLQLGGMKEFAVRGDEIQDIQDVPEMSILTGVTKRTKRHIEDTKEVSRIPRGEQDSRHWGAWRRLELLALAFRRLQALTCFSALRHSQVVPLMWPVEVRLCVASFLPWTELVADSCLCHSWRILEMEDTLWQVYFASIWPRMARRKKAAADDQGLPWRALFRAQWSKGGNRQEDALEEDWLDFSAAQGLEARVASQRPPVLAWPEKLQRATQRCREDLQRQNVKVPAEPDASHTCTQHCRFHPLLLEDADAFLCEESGALHVCENVPCSCCVASSEGFLVCPVSGRCFPKNSTVNEEMMDAPVSYDWDPDLSAAQQVGRWFEQGYFMSEEQALKVFDGSGAGRRPAVRRSRNDLFLRASHSARSASAF